MADLSITAANVVTVGTTGINLNKQYNAAVAITAGQSVYLDANNRWAKADASLDINTTFGIAMNSAPGAYQPLSVALSGTVVDLGVTLTQGWVYVISSTAGGICPIEDLVSTDYVYILGFADDDDNLVLDFANATYTYSP